VGGWGLQLGAGQYFGERALLGNARRAANVIARGNVQCLSISRAVFEEVNPPCLLKEMQRSDEQTITLRVHAPNLNLAQDNILLCYVEFCFRNAFQVNLRVQWEY